MMQASPRNATTTPSFRDIIAMFGMERYQTAGWFSQHYNDGEIWGRAKLSSAYHLLIRGDAMPLHKIDSIEVWHYYLGAPARVVVSNGVRDGEATLLGSDLAAGQRPQLAIPAYSWQAIEALGEWTLLGCTMSPGYSPRSAIVLSGDG